MKIFSILFLFISLLLPILSHSQSYYSRSFRLGFTPFPPTYDENGYKTAYDILKKHADIVSHTFQDGIPWQQALTSSNYKDYPQSLQDYWDYLLNQDVTNIPNAERYISILPMDITYMALALSWGQGPNQALVDPWSSCVFDSPIVKQALLNYSIAAIEHFKPKYFGLGVEVNILMAKRFDLWVSYKNLNQYIYTELKKRYPELVVFPTIQYEHMLGLQQASQVLADWLKLDYPGVLWKEVYDLLTYSDALALSTFPYLSYGNQVYQGYYDLALNLASALNKPIVIDQMGLLSQNVNAGSILLSGSPADQSNFIYYVLSLGLQNKFLFAINFFNADYGTNYGTDPISISWAYSGLIDTSGNAKPALGVWDQFLAMPYSP